MLKVKQKVVLHCFGRFIFGQFKRPTCYGRSFFKNIGHNLRICITQLGVEYDTFYNVRG